MSVERPIRLFLDAGVILDGCFSSWGASKAVLILATMRERFTVILAESIEREVQRAVARRTANLEAALAESMAGSVAGWLARVRIERHPTPPEAFIRERVPDIMPALRHLNDLQPVMTALLAHPDLVLSTNTAHWNEKLAERTGLRVATPHAFLRTLYTREQG